MKDIQSKMFLKSTKSLASIFVSLLIFNLPIWTLNAQTYKTTGTQNIVAFMVNFQNNPGEKPWTLTQANSFLFNDVNNLFKENSYQQFSITGKVYDWITLNMDGGSCPSGITDEVDKMAAAIGVDYSLYDQVIYFIVGSGCGGNSASTAKSPQRVSITAGLTLKTVAHEMLHNLGRGHSNALDCVGDTIDESCKIIEYGDVYDVMGASLPGQLNSFHKERLGWLNGNQTPTILEITSSGRYFINPIETVENNVKAVKIFKDINLLTGKKNYYYLDIRRPINLDKILFERTTVNHDNLLNGVLVRTAEEGGRTSNLVDMTPDSSPWGGSFDFRDAALTVGNTFVDTISGISITTISSDSTGALVDIQIDNSGTTINKSPIANNDSVETTENMAITINVLANDSDSDGDKLSVSSVSGVDGNALINGDNTITFTPMSGFKGIETFSYTISDGNGGTANANVNVTVNADIVTNNAPVASFAFTCSELSCNFKDTSSDSDGNIASRTFSFGDGQNSIVASPSHTYNLAGDYIVNLTVTDDDGDKSSVSKIVNVTAPISNTTIHLDVTLIKNKGTKIATLKWSGATGNEIRVYRDNSQLLTTLNDGHHEDIFKGKGTRTYRVCELNTNVCSVTVTAQE